MDQLYVKKLCLEKIQYGYLDQRILQKYLKVKLAIILNVEVILHFLNTEMIVKMFINRVVFYPRKNYFRFILFLKIIKLILFQINFSKLINKNYRNGEEWSRIRKEFQKALSKPRNIITYIDKTDNAIKKFVTVCGKNSHSGLLPLLNRLSLEREH